MAQGGLLEDPGFLKEIVERVLQELLEAEMSEPVGALLPTSAQRTAPATVTAISPAPSGREGRHPEPDRAPGQGGDLLHAPLFPLPAQREGACSGADGDVRRGGLNEESQGRNRGFVWDLLLKEPGFLAGR